MELDFKFVQGKYHFYNVHCLVYITYMHYYYLPYYRWIEFAKYMVCRLKICV